MTLVDEHDPYVNNINYFSELPMAKEEQQEYIEMMFDLQHAYNTRSKGLPS